MQKPISIQHELRIEPRDEQTVGLCSCGSWVREVTLETVAITGRSREEALRAAHHDHARSIGGPSRGGRRGGSRTKSFSLAGYAGKRAPTDGATPCSFSPSQTSGRCEARRTRRELSVIVAR